MIAQPRVLVVDDTPAIIECASFALLDEGYEVYVATNGQIALQVIDAWPPDLILLDGRMPIMDGRQFAAAYAGRPGPTPPWWFSLLPRMRQAWP